MARRLYRRRLKYRHLIKLIKNQLNQSLSQPSERVRVKDLTPVINAMLEQVKLHILRGYRVDLPGIGSLLAVRKRSPIAPSGVVYKVKLETSKGMAEAIRERLQYSSELKAILGDEEESQSDNP